MALGASTGLATAVAVRQSPLGGSGTLITVLDWRLGPILRVALAVMNGAGRVTD